jgi:hypothetical protein
MRTGKIKMADVKTEKRYHCLNRRCGYRFDRDELKIDYAYRPGLPDTHRCPKCGGTWMFDAVSHEQWRQTAPYKFYTWEEHFGDLISLDLVASLGISMIFLFMGLSDSTNVFLGISTIGVILLVQVLFFFIAFGDLMYDLIRYKGKIPTIAQMDEMKKNEAEQSMRFSK